MDQRTNSLSIELKRPHHISTATSPLLIAVFLSLWMSAPAWSQVSEEKMNESIEAVITGESQFKAEAYIKAAESYRRAYDVFPQPKLLEKIARSYERAFVNQPSYCAEAETAWRTFLRVCGECERKPFALRKVDHVSQQCADLRAKQTSNQAVERKVQPVQPVTWPGWSIGGVGVASILVGGGLHFSASQTAGDIDRTERSEYNRDVETIESRERLAWISYGVGTLLITTAALLLSSDSSSTVGAGPSGMSTLAWTF
jgi:hypothetical protein